MMYTDGVDHYVSPSYGKDYSIVIMLHTFTIFRMLYILRRGGYLIIIRFDIVAVFLKVLWQNFYPFKELQLF